MLERGREMKDVLRKITLNGYTLETYDTGNRDRRGQTCIGYSLTHPSGWVVFEGEDFCSSPMHCDDSNANIRSLMSFLTLAFGYTDREYFEGYTPKQLAWVESQDREDLEMLVFEGEEGFGPLADEPSDFEEESEESDEDS
jgi:hypothetical protein